MPSLVVLVLVFLLVFIEVVVFRIEVLVVVEFFLVVVLVFFILIRCADHGLWFFIRLTKYLQGHV